MSRRLVNPEDWPSLAKAARYSATTLAWECGFSPRQLERHFERQFQMTARRWLRNLRMEHAVRLLNEKKPVKIVAAELGYAYPEHFARAFTGHFGVAPSAYRLAGFVTGQMRARVLAACWWLFQLAEEAVDALNGLGLS